MTPTAPTLAEIKQRSIDDDDAHPNGLADQSCKDRAALIAMVERLAGALADLAIWSKGCVAILAEDECHVLAGGLVARIKEANKALSALGLQQKDGV